MGLGLSESDCLSLCLFVFLSRSGSLSFHLCLPFSFSVGGIPQERNRQFSLLPMEFLSPNCPRTIPYLYLPSWECLSQVRVLDLGEGT